VSEAILKAITVAAELTGTELSKDAAHAMLDDLNTYPEAQVIAALHRCRKELKGRMSPADIINRIDDGRPGPEEAWAMIPKDDAGSVVWTDEMAAAFRISAPILYEGDAIAARMAFKEAYLREVAKAKDDGIPPRWFPSFGFSQAGREAALIEAAGKGHISYQRAANWLPESPALALMRDNKQMVRA